MEPAETILVANLKITISRAFGPFQATGDSDPPVNWWAIPRCPSGTKDNIQNKHPKQTLKTNLKQHLKQTQYPEIFACLKNNGDSGASLSGERFGSDTAQFYDHTS